MFFIQIIQFINNFIRLIFKISYIFVFYFCKFVFKMFPVFKLITSITLNTITTRAIILFTSTDNLIYIKETSKRAVAIITDIIFFTLTFIINFLYLFINNIFDRLRTPILIRFIMFPRVLFYAACVNIYCRREGREGRRTNPL